jgi:thiol:disulfide interchange protein DsbA
MSAFFSGGIPMLRSLFFVLIAFSGGSAALAQEEEIAAPSWRLGMHYEELDPPQRTHVRTDKIEVMEIFWYGCSHCNRLETPLKAWLATKPGYVEFIRVPVLWKPARSHARLFYTLQALNRTDLHNQVFDEIFRKGNILASNDEDKAFLLQLEFAKAHGVDPERFKETYHSSLIDGYLKWAEDVGRSYKISGVPSIVVNGRYLSDDDRAGGEENLVELIQYLVTSEYARLNRIRPVALK